jgi:SPP1 family predicted phage head-tail adaptor
MKAGPRNRLITIERAAMVTDAYGGETPTWEEHVRAYAYVSFGTGQERREAAQETAGAAATFRTLWTPTLAAVKVTDRISFDGSAWDISSAVPLGLNEGMEFTATRAA